MDDQGNVGYIVKSIKRRVSNQGMEVLEPTAFFDGINKLYIKPSLRQVIDEELPRIIKADPRFFERYDINLPENQEVHLFDLYYDKHSRRGMERVYHSAKVWFRHLRFFLINHPDQDELNHAVDEYKKILEGNYFDEPS